MSSDSVTFSNRGVFYRQYNGESDLQYIMSLVQNELSEPYVIYTYRYFLQGWPNLSFLAFPESADGTCPANAEPIGVIVCKQSIHKGKARRGYIAMLSVDRAYRKRGIASNLVKLSIDMMTQTGADEIVLETEVDNDAALGLYSSLGFIREKRLYRFYMNGKDAFRLVLPVLPMDPSLSPSTSMNPITINVANLGPMEPNMPFGDSAHSQNQPSSSARAGSTAPISVPLAVYRAAHFNLPTEPMGKTIGLDTPPSADYPAQRPTNKVTLLNADNEEAGRSRSRFALGGLLGAASPRSLSTDSRDSIAIDSPSSSLNSGHSGIDSSPALTRMGSTNSTDSDIFALYGSHIPASISPPIPKRSRPAVSVTSVIAAEEFYISTR